MEDTPIKLQQGEQWFVVRTKVRQETVARDNLERQGFRPYLPMLRAARRRSGRWCNVVEALFPGYLFVAVNILEQSTAPIRSTRGALGLVRFGGELCSVPNEVVDGIMRLQPECEAAVEPARLFKKGEAVTILDGPFAGLSAVFEANDGKERALLLLELLGRVNRVTLHTDQVAPAY